MIESHKTAVIGFLGTTLDNGFNDKRWQRWRPNVSLCLHDDLLVDELHILYSKRDKRLFNVIVDDVAKSAPIPNHWASGDAGESVGFCRCLC